MMMGVNWHGDLDGFHRGPYYRSGNGLLGCRYCSNNRKAERLVWQLTIIYSDGHIEKQQYLDYGSAEMGYKSVIQFYFTRGYRTTVNDTGEVVIKDENDKDFATLRLSECVNLATA